MRRQVDVHNRKRTGGRQTKGKDGAVQAARYGEDHRQHHNQAGVEENGKAHDQ